MKDCLEIVLEAVNSRRSGKYVIDQINLDMTADELADILRKLKIKDVPEGKYRAENHDHFTIEPTFTVWASGTGNTNNIVQVNLGRWNTQQWQGMYDFTWYNGKIDHVYREVLLDWGGTEEKSANAKSPKAQQILLDEFKEKLRG